MTAPASGSGKVLLTGRSTGIAKRLSVSLPSTLSNSSVEVSTDGTAVYSPPGSQVSAAVQAFSDSARIATIIYDTSAPTSFAYGVDLPQSGSLQTTDQGTVLILDSQGGVVGGFAKPWARDAKGTVVATRYEVQGNLVTQTVDVAGRSLSYPIVADPWLWIDLISSASWVRNPSYGWTLQVTPTGWARANAGGYAVGVAGWNELYSKYKNRGLNTNLSGMRDQFICHQQVVAVIAPTKATWNIDEWRPSVGYVATVNAKCNPGQPGGGKIID